MSFEPSANPNEPELEGADELRMPDDLEALGEQLRNDAVHLASWYPALEFDPESGTFKASRVVPGRGQRWSSDKRVTWRKQGLVFAILAAASLFLLLLPNVAVRWQQKPETSVVSGSPADVPGSADQVITPGMEPPGSIEFSPVGFLRSASGPELEGMLDLFEEVVAQPTTLSI